MVYNNRLGPLQEHTVSVVERVRILHLPLFLCVSFLLTFPLSLSHHVQRHCLPIYREYSSYRVKRKPRGSSDCSDNTSAQQFTPSLSPRSISILFFHSQHHSPSHSLSLPRFHFTFTKGEFFVASFLSIPTIFDILFIPECFACTTTFMYKYLSAVRMQVLYVP